MQASKKIRVLVVDDSAIKTGAVDQVLPIESIYQGIEKRVQHVFGAAKVGAV